MPSLLKLLALACIARASDDAAIAVIAMGELAEESLFGMCVRSIRERGAFVGTVYAFTDKPRCAPRGVVVVPVRLEDRCDARAGSILYKQLKMRVLDVAAAGPERVVLYMDADVIVGAPLAPLLATAVAALATSPATLLVYEEAEVTADVRDPGRLATEPYHGGIFAVARGKSEPCLAAWAARVLDELRRAAAANREGARIKRSSVRDQPLLREIIESGACVFAPLPPETLSKPTPAAIDGARYAVLNHLSRTSRLKGKRNGHGITKAHHAKLGADLLGVRGAAAKEKWWMAPRCPDLAPEREAPPLVLDCDVATTTTREVGT